MTAQHYWHKYWQEEMTENRLKEEGKQQLARQVLLAIWKPSETLA